MRNECNPPGDPSFGERRVEVLTTGISIPRSGAVRPLLGLVGVVTNLSAAATAFRSGDQVVGLCESASAGGPGTCVWLDQDNLAPRLPDFGQAPNPALVVARAHAWFLLFERLAITASSRGSLLLSSGDGLLRKAAAELARKATQLTIIALSESEEACGDLTRAGADHTFQDEEELRFALANCPAALPIYAILNDTPDDQAWSAAKVAGILAASAPQGAERLVHLIKPGDLEEGLFKQADISIADVLNELWGSAPLGLCIT